MDRTRRDQGEGSSPFADLGALVGGQDPRRFLRRIVAKLNQLHPEVVFITGDMYDGTSVDVDAMAQPW